MYRINRKKQQNAIIVCIIGIQLVAVSLLSISLLKNDNTIIISTAIKPSTPCAPIDIDGNTALSSFGFASGGDGSSWAQAIIIEGYEITTTSQPNIRINNTDLYLIIRNCTLTNAPNEYTGIDLMNCSNLRITNCTFINVNRGIYATGCLNIQITLNILEDPHRESFWLKYTNHSIISENDINSPGEAIYLEVSEYNLIEKNTVTNGNDYGINLYESHYSTVSENTISNCSYGIDFQQTNHSIIADNIVSNNQDSGIFLDNCLENVSVIGNTAINNIFDGIYLQHSNNVLVTMNSVYANDQYGIHVYGTSENNTIFLNYINNNDISQAYSYSYNDETSDWDNGTHGNYWGDYETLFPSATNDGTVWDTPYPINNSNSVEDSYPLAVWPLPEGDDDDGNGDGNDNAVPTYLPGWILTATITGTVLILAKNKNKLSKN